MLISSLPKGVMVIIKFEKKAAHFIVESGMVSQMGDFGAIEVIAGISLVMLKLIKSLFLNNSII